MLQNSETKTNTNTQYLVILQRYKQILIAIIAISGYNKESMVVYPVDNSKPTRPGF